MGRREGGREGTAGGERRGPGCDRMTRKSPSRYCHTPHPPHSQPYALALPLPLSFAPLASPTFALTLSSPSRPPTYLPTCPFPTSHILSLILLTALSLPLTFITALSLTLQAHTLTLSLTLTSPFRLILLLTLALLFRPFLLPFPWAESDTPPPSPSARWSKLTEVCF